MSEFSRLLSLRKQARAAARQRRDLAGLSRTVQVLRSTVTVGDDDIDLDDVLSGAVGTGETTLELESDVNYLDDGMDADTILGSGAAADAGDLAEVTDAIPDMGDVFDQAADADDEAHEGRMNSIANTAEVSKALEQADAAAQKAAAATETALGFARYSQVDGGPIVPDLPEDGPRVGAELVFIDTDGHPYQSNVWNGDTWVEYQLLLDQVLVLGPDGTVQIVNGKVISPEIIGGDITGVTVTGSIVRNAATGQRMQLDEVGLRAFNSAGLVMAALAADSGGLSLAGVLTSYLGGNNPRARLSDGALEFDLPESPGAARSKYAPGGIEAFGTEARFQIINQSGGASSGIDLFTTGSIGIHSGRIASTRSLSTLWEGALYMTENQRANLTGRISDQLTGIVLAWSKYDNDVPLNNNWGYVFVPKSHVDGQGINNNLMVDTAVVRKYTPITDTQIQGHAVNGGASSKLALRGVYGV